MGFSFLKAIPENYRKTELQKLVIEKAESAAKLLRSLGVPAVGCSDAGLARLYLLSHDQLQSACSFLDAFVAPELVSTQLTLGARIGDRTLLQRFFERSGTWIDESAYSLLKDGDLVEVHNLNFVQVFRNLRFMECVSYTLLDLSTFEFFELFERSTQITSNLLALATSLSAEHRKGVPLHTSVPPHILRERFSEERREMFATFTWAIPVFRGEADLVGVVTLKEAAVPTQYAGNKLNYI